MLALSRGCCSSNTPGGWGSTRTSSRRWSPRRPRMATRAEDLDSLTLLKLLTTARPGVARSAERLGRRGRRGDGAGRAGSASRRWRWRCGRRPPTRYMCAGDLDRVERVRGGDAGADRRRPGPRRRHRHRQPAGLGADRAGAGPARARRRRGGRARCSTTALAEAAARDDLETESWALRLEGASCSPTAATLEAGAGARRCATAS